MSMEQRSHGPQGPHNREDLDNGCSYSEGNQCRHCPFKECIEGLENGERIKFGIAWKNDQAIAWRRNMWQVKSALDGSPELADLLDLQWKPFGVTLDGLVCRVWLRKNPVETAEESDGN